MPWKRLSSPWYIAMIFTQPALSCHLRCVRLAKRFQETGCNGNSEDLELQAWFSSGFIQCCWTVAIGFEQHSRG